MIQGCKPRSCIRKRVYFVFLGRAAVTAVAFADKVLDEYGRDPVNKTDQDRLIQIAMDFIEKQHSHVKLNRTYKILEKSHVGNLKIIQESLQKAFMAKEKSIDDNLSNILKNFTPLATENPTTLLQQLNSENEKNEAEGIEKNIAGINLNVKEDKATCLIEEVSSTSTFPEPKYDLTQTVVSGVKCFHLKVTLPSVESVSECELDISRVSDRTLISLFFPLYFCRILKTRQVLNNVLQHVRSDCSFTNALIA